MVKDKPNVSPLTKSDWHHTWGARLGGAHEPLMSEAVAMVSSVPGGDRTGPNLSAFEASRTPPLSRTIAVWILVGALWISIGMIVSATVVTVAFLA